MSDLRSQIPEDRTFAEHLHAERTARGLSQRDLAAELGVSPSTIYQWESGTHTPTKQRLRAKLADWLRRQPDTSEMTPVVRLGTVTISTTAESLADDEFLQETVDELDGHPIEIEYL